MNKQLKILIIDYLLFLCFMLLSSVTQNTLLSTVFSLSAFVLPTIVGIIAIYEVKKSSHPVALVAFLDLEDEDAVPPKTPEELKIGITRNGVAFALPLIIPTLLLVFLAANLFGYIGSLVGLSSPNVTTSFLSALLFHALVPAVFEELLFRYIPIKLIGEGGNMRYALLVSSLIFALSHHNPVQIPYAFIAGIILFWISVCSSSIIPSIVIHLANNTLSLAISFGYFGTVGYIILAVLLIISLVFAIRGARCYINKTSEYFAEPMRSFSPIPLLFIIPSIIVTLLTLF